MPHNPIARMQELSLFSSINIERGSVGLIYRYGKVIRLLRHGEQLGLRERRDCMLYVVDERPHHLIFMLDLPFADSSSPIPARVEIEYRVVDPIQIIEKSVDDTEAAVIALLGPILQKQSRETAPEEFRDLEEKAMRSLSQVQFRSLGLDLERFQVNVELTPELLERSKLKLSMLESTSEEAKVEFYKQVMTDLRLLATRLKINPNEVESILEQRDGPEQSRFERLVDLMRRGSDQNDTLSDYNIEQIFLALFGGNAPTTGSSNDIGLPPIAPETSEVQIEKVRFSIYHPKDVGAGTWNTFLAYIYNVSAAQLVREDAQRFESEMANLVRAVSNRQTTQLTRGTEICIVPEAEGIEFNPRSLVLAWVEDYERANFRFRAKPELVDQPCFGEVTFSVGPLEIARVKFSIFVNDPAKQPDKFESNKVSATAEMYKKIFASYSHDDAPIVTAVTRALKAIGYNVLIDYDTIRSGEGWKEALKQMIDQADIFQLFWSRHSSQSMTVRDEWSYALGSRGKNDKPESRCVGFIRPVFWEQPMPDPPQELAHLHFKYLPELAKPFVSQ